MAKFVVKIESILGGIAPNLYIGRKDQFSASIGIDPDLPLSNSPAIKTSGVIRPSNYSKFSGAKVNSVVNWIITNSKDEKLRVLCENGRFIEYDETLSTETLLGTISPAGGNGAAYYNNYIYLAGTTDISRYGPLDGTPSLVDNVWTGTTLGSKNALGNLTYPTQRGVTLPNHPMHVHSDNKLYIGDFEEGAVANKGRGKIHFIKTKNGTSEGDTDDGTSQDVFFLPYGYTPTAIASWGLDLAVAAIPAGSGNTIIGGKAKIFLWDAVNAPSLPYREITLIDPVVTALLNHNGNLFIWSGNMNNGVRVSVYQGGYSVKQLAFFEEGFSPPAGAVDGLGNRIAWGAFTTYPENSASVYALGYKNGNLPLTLHNIINTSASASSTAEMVTAIKYAQHPSFVSPRFIVAWRDSSNYGIDKLSNTASVALFRSLHYMIGAPFRINKVSIPLGEAVTDGHNLEPKIYTDQETTGNSLTTINNTNYPGKRRIVYYPNIKGTNDFMLQLRWNGTRVLPVIFPIIIEGETKQDATE